MEKLIAFNQILGYFKSYPLTKFGKLGLIVSIKAKEFEDFARVKNKQHIHPSALSADELFKNTIELLYNIDPGLIEISISTTLIEKNLSRKEKIYRYFLYPLIDNINKNWSTYLIDEYPLDLYSIEGLFDGIKTALTNDVLNTILTVTDIY